MKKLCILTCRLADDVCTGSGCLRAFHERTGAFARYGREPLELCAFMRCGGCQGVRDRGPYDQGIFPSVKENPGMAGKLDALQSHGIDTVHLGICCWNAAGERCPAMAELEEELRLRGIAVVKGTH